MASQLLVLVDWEIAPWGVSVPLELINGASKRWYEMWT